MDGEDCKEPTAGWSGFLLGVLILAGGVGGLIVVAAALDSGRSLLTYPWQETVILLLLTGAILVVWLTGCIGNGFRRLCSLSWALARGKFLCRQDAICACQLCERWVVCALIAGVGQVAAAIFLRINTDLNTMYKAMPGFHPPTTLRECLERNPLLKDDLFGLFWMVLMVSVITALYYRAKSAMRFAPETIEPKQTITK